MRLLAERPDLKCLFMSGYTADIITDNDVADRAADFIQKPFAVRALAERVRAILDRR